MTLGVIVFVWGPNSVAELCIKTIYHSGQVRDTVFRLRVLTRKQMHSEHCQLFFFNLYVVWKGFCVKNPPSQRQHNYSDDP